ncbi:MAG TPA: hypothetical protein VL652_09290 [Kutzneria sp.]|jgi:hypothetical protein|nr:hypothetical protein [Kutzneria sp.]
MRYQQVRWQHDHPDEPVDLFSEVGPDGYEMRRVDRFADGRLQWSDDTGAGTGQGVGEVPIDPVAEINAVAGFLAAEITQARFERVWAAARRLAQAAIPDSGNRSALPASSDHCLPSTPCVG